MFVSLVVFVVFVVFVVVVVVVVVDDGSAVRCMFSSSLEAAEANTCMKSGRFCGGPLCWTPPLSSCESLTNFEASCCCCFWILCFLANLVAEPDFLRPPPEVAGAADGGAPDALGVPMPVLWLPSLFR